MNSLRKLENSMIFICLTPNPKGEYLKIIEFEAPDGECILGRSTIH